MNKFFNKIAIGIASIAMAIGVGVGIAGNNKAPKPVEAVGEAWTKITKISEITDGSKIMIVNNNYYLPARKFAAKQSGGAAFDVSSDTLENPVWDVTVAGGSYKFSVTDSNKTYYLYVTNDNNGVVADSGDTNAAKTWSIEKHATADTFMLTSSDGTNTRYITHASGNFRCYKTTGSTGDKYCSLYKKAAAIASLDSISVQTAPTKTLYAAGECFDPTGLVITRNYSDSSSDTLPYVGNETKFTFSPNLTTPLTKDDSAVSISYGNKSTSQAISVKTVTSVSLDGDMTKKDYVEQDEWDFSGLYLTISWSIGDSTTINLTDVDPSIYELSVSAPVIGTKELYIFGMYDGVEFETTIQEINVNKRPLADVLRTASTSLSLTSTSYTNFSKKTNSLKDIASNATWAGTACCNTQKNNALQLNGTSRGIYTTDSSGQYVKSVSVDFYDANGKKLYFYGSNTAYTAINDSIATDENSELIATLDADTLSKDITKNYKYVYIYSNGAIYMNSITVEWKSARELVESLFTQSSLAYNYHKDDEGNFTYTNMSIRFGGKVAKDLWNEINNVTGFGVMITDGDNVRDYEEFEDKLNLVVSSNDSVDIEHNIVDYFVPVENLETVIGDDNNGNYFWNLRWGTDFDNKDKMYSTVAYIKIGSEYVFLKKERTCVTYAAIEYMNSIGNDATFADGSLQNIINSSQFE